MMVPDVPVLLLGYGPVGMAYAELLARVSKAAVSKAAVPDVTGQRGGGLRLAAVVGRSAQCVVGEDGVRPRAEWEPRTPLADLLDQTGARVVVQATPSHPDLAAPAVEDALTAWRHGAHLVTATKCHVLADWRRLRQVSTQARLGFGLSATTGAALPAADVARSALLGYDVQAVRACLNGTSTYVVDRMSEGMTLAEAVGEARRRGIAEADPSADLSGADAAGKVRILAGLLWDWDVSTLDVDLAPVDEGTAAEAVAARRSGARLRPVATASLDQPGTVRVRLARVEQGDPLHAINGPEKAVSYDCGEVGVVTVSGGASSPLGAATAMLKDTLRYVTADPLRLGAP
ncbi:homoserine dehydrogenase [Actinopolymorpha pittospori]|uniref:Homoserine dehydrogenase n=2 Tax=Actinopolymorpha pittospori TaxID=648752 RepID=A0A927RMR8_9ACTN|nr:homoserine dehydrogenase [Actinopolymorpha pittospori]